MDPSDRPAALLWLVLTTASIVFWYWIAAKCAEIYRERPVVIRNERTGRLEVRRDLRQPR